MSVGGPLNPVILDAFEGLNTIDSPRVRPGGMRPGQARLLENLETTTGELRTRKGHIRVRSAKVDGTRPILGIWRVYKGTDGTRQTLIHTRNKFWKLSGSAAVSITGSAVSITSGHAYTLLSYQDVVYGSNGVDKWWKWTFSGKLAVPTAPAEDYRFVFPFEEKIVHARGETNKNKVTWADEGLPETVQTLNFIFYPPDRSDDLTLAWPLNGEIIFATTQRIGKTIGGLPPHAVVDIDLGKGCATHYSAAVLMGWLYFVGLAGRVYRTDGNVVQEVSRDLDTSDISLTNDDMVRGVAHEGRFYRLSYPSKATGATFPDRIVTYDAWKDEWHGPHKGMRVSAWTEWRTPNDDGRILGGTPSGHVATMWSGSSDAGTRITGVYEGATFPGPDPSYRSSIDEYEIHGENITSGTATLGIFYDRQGTASTIGTVSLKASGTVEGDRDNTTVTRTYLYEPKKVNFSQTGREFQPRLSVAQKAGRARISLLRLNMRQIKGR